MSEQEQLAEDVERAQKYNPEYRPYRAAVYVVFVSIIVWLGGSITWAVVSHLYY